jgi:hypothetical protein
MRVAPRSVSGIEPILWASALRAWARLGPLGTESQGTAFLHGRLIATLFAAIAHPTGWPGGFPTGRPWDFAIPDPIPRIIRASSPVTRRLTRLGSDAPGIGGLSPRGPVTPLAATLTRLACSTFCGRLVSGGLAPPTAFTVAFACALRRRRWPPTPAVPAIPCFARPFDSFGSRTQYSGAFSTFAERFLVRRRTGIYAMSRKNR